MEPKCGTNGHGKNLMPMMPSGGKINKRLSEACNHSPGFQFDFLKSIEQRGVAHNFESGPTKDFSDQVSEQKILMWFILSKYA